MHIACTHFNTHAHVEPPPTSRQTLQHPPSWQWPRPALTLYPSASSRLIHCAHTPSAAPSRPHAAVLPGVHDPWGWTHEPLVQQNSTAIAGSGMTHRGSPLMGGPQAGATEEGAWWEASGHWGLTALKGDCRHQFLLLHSPAPMR